MLKIQDIKQLELELSSICNASCPLCPRNLFGYDTDLRFKKRNLTLNEVKTILTKDFLSQINFVKFEGNLGDPLANPDILQITDYLDLPVKCVTNGNFRNKKFWESFAERKTTVEFGIDGIDQETHTRYRKGTRLKNILANASAYIQSGGTAIWKMIKFDFNQDQISQCEQLSKDMGFSNFIVVDHGRNSGPVFDSTGKLIDVIGNFNGSLDFQHYFDLHKNGEMLLEDIDDEPCATVSCQSLNEKMIYISSDGHVFPCCFMGFSPSTYGKGRWHEPINKQLAGIIKKNNALIYDLETCIDWFNSIEERWGKDTFENGRLVVCDSSCGRCK